MSLERFSVYWRCNTCGKELDQPADPSSRDCGGDCAGCMAWAGDPDCANYLSQSEDEPYS